jgi:hypothetical protein
MKQDTRHKAVILAYLEGNEVQYKPSLGEWSDIKYPTFLEHFDYRIKPEPKLIPFDFSDAEMLVNKIVKSKDGSIVSLITDAGIGKVWVGKWGDTYDNLLKDYTFLDGSPCGKEVAE